MSSVQNFVAGLPAIDWSQREAAYHIASEILSRMARDKEMLRALLFTAAAAPELRRMHECHTFDDKIVLFDALESKGYRVRFRLGKSANMERVHNHRFDAVHLILTGGYLHRIYKASLDETEAIIPSSVELLAVKNERPGTAILISSDVFHSTATDADTVSLLLRGPTRREKAAQFDLSTGLHSVQRSEQDEAPSRRLQVGMPDDMLQRWIDKLEQLGVV